MAAPFYILVRSWGREKERKENKENWGGRERDSSNGCMFCEVYVSF